MTTLKRDWAVSFTLSLTLFTAFLFFLEAQSNALIFNIYIEEQPTYHFIYWLLHYPSELFTCVFPIGLVIFLTRLWRLRAQKIKLVTWYMLTFVCIATLLSCGWLIVMLTITDRSHSRHVSTIELGDTTYQFGEMSSLGLTGYVLAECDQFGLLCDTAYITLYYEEGPGYFQDVRLIVHPSSYQESLVLEIDGETVYIAPRFSP